MIALIALCFVIAGAFASPQFSIVPTITTQHHSQDELGQYRYGYSGGPSAKEEIRTADGITRGSYSYIDSYGLVQTTSYVSDPLNGFRVAATNLPVGPSPIVPSAIGVPETPEVVVAKAAHFAAHNEAIARLGRKKRDLVPYSGLVGLPVEPLVSKYHAQDELGQYSYGYNSPLSSKAESRTADGITRGSYSYVDAHGLVQTAHYVADALGFRVAATNTPVA